ncbi:lysophospholipid acyltransferase family protein [Nitrospirillum sp. BR 11828]|uniref:lysophospholipid acyltransferase family protein n=1 Tax=Nitrospirillum sp. BR 11828 TaxID=3104325 RepID=UPI002ACA3FBE|nr:lysophospholipid acyltransferase family protein [Nitrospirillum sp. BR 11828]MDZ5647206.1 lysophospholipid acyltransferase family protein [Nitrospirillum sp. BR 11828]
MAEHGTQPSSLRYAIEAAGIRALFRLLRLLPADVASDFGGWVGRTLGPRLGGNAKVLRNLEQAMPHLDAAARRRVARDCWDNLVRTLAEYPHLKTISREWEQRVELIGAEHVRGLVTDGKPGVILTGHFGNWELVAMTVFKCDATMTAIYRAPNNPSVDKLLSEARGELGTTLVPKGRASAKGILAAMRAGGILGILADQKLNEGIPVPFLGRDAMTGTIAGDVVVRHGAVVVPVRVTRKAKGARFRIEAFPPMDLPAPTGDRPADIRAITVAVNQLLERWVLENPGQWLWTHRRWPK